MAIFYEFQKMIDNLHPEYHRRGWTLNGIPTPQKMRALGFGNEKAGLNKWGGKYRKGESPPTTDAKYWEKW